LHGIKIPTVLYQARERPGRKTPGLRKIFIPQKRGLIAVPLPAVTVNWCFSPKI